MTRAFTGIFFAGVIVLSLVCVSAAPAFAQENEVPEVELYQDDTGEWKVKYVNTSEPVTADPTQNTAVAASDPENLEVELYQDATGEWKVKYVNRDAIVIDSKPAAADTISETAVAKKGLEAAAIEAKTVTVQAKQAVDDKVDGAVKSTPVKSVQEFKKEEVIKADTSVAAPSTKKTEPAKEELFGSKPVTMDEAELSPVTKVQPKAIVKSAPKPKATSNLAKPVTKIEEPVYEIHPEESFRNPDHRFEVGMSTAYFNFNQDTRINAIGIPFGKSNEGMLYGIHGGYEYILNDNAPKRTLGDVFWNIDEVNRYLFSLDYKTGATTYSDINNVQEQDFTQHIIEGRAIAGYDFNATANTRVTPFFGVGYRYQHDPSGSILDLLNGGTITTMDNSVVYVQIDPSRDLRQPYDVDTHNIYFPIGLMTHTDINDSISIGINLETDVFIWGMVKSRFSDAGDLYVEDLSSTPVPPSGTPPIPRTLRLSDTTNKLRGGFGFKGSTRVTLKQNKFDWYVEPYIRYWHFKESEKEQFPLLVSDGTDVILFENDGVTPVNWVEAESSTTEYGLQVGVSF